MQNQQAPDDAHRSPHLRHTSLSQGVSLKNVSSMLGHASVKMTERYARVRDSSVLRDMDAIRDTLNLEIKFSVLR